MHGLGGEKINEAYEMATGFYVEEEGAIRGI